MKILLLGANGQVGWELQRSLSPLGDLIACDRTSADLGTPGKLRALVEKVRPDVIVNAAAYTAVDRAEADENTARRVNAEAVAELANAARAADAWFVHYSTDYVFDGSKQTPWNEEDPTAPLNVYGQTKLDGLRAVEQSGCNFLIFRVTWIYSEHGVNFPNTILRLAAEREEISVVCDQFGAPTPADWIAEMTALCLAQVLEDQRKCGIYNLAPLGSASWYDFAKEIVVVAQARGAVLKLAPDAIKAVPASAYSTVAKRPTSSVLDTEKLQNTFAIEIPDWLSLFRREGLRL